MMLIDEHESMPARGQIFIAVSEPLLQRESDNYSATANQTVSLSGSSAGTKAAQAAPYAKRTFFVGLSIIVAIIEAVQYRLLFGS